MSLITVATSLFFVLNSIGNIPFFVGLLSPYPVKRQRQIIIREMLIALFILFLFNFFGQNILHALGIEQYVMGIAGGALLFLIALTMMFPKSTSLKMLEQEPLIFPLALPAIAGPGAITTVMLYTKQLQSPVHMIVPIVLAWTASALILLASSNIKLLLGNKGLIACERLGGIIVSLIAVRMFTHGIIDLIHSNFP